jgi:hypothetical protein
MLGLRVIMQGFIEGFIGVIPSAFEIIAKIIGKVIFGLAEGLIFVALFLTTVICIKLYYLFTSITWGALLLPFFKFIDRSAMMLVVR